jgi:hypothetical protein
MRGQLIAYGFTTYLAIGATPPDGAFVAHEDLGTARALVIDAVRAMIRADSREG